MPLKLLIDESVDFRIVKKLKAFDFQIVCVADISRGSPDFDVLELARKHNSILITEDRNFG